MASIVTEFRFLRLGHVTGRPSNLKALEMTNFDRREWILAACVSALAGYVDALAFLKLGFFVSHMSGDSTRLGVGVAEWSSNAAVAGSLIGMFVVGVASGSLVGGAVRVYRRSAVLVLVSLLLASAAALNLAAAVRPAIAAMALAMGAVNGVFEQNGNVRIGLTYMTGTLVKLGQRVAAAMAGGEPFAWTSYLLQWGALVVGAVTGAKLYSIFGLSALWTAAFAAAVLAAITAHGNTSGPQP
jgi:uncharacterized membrane protein YoaK (UPF0700 family)